MRFTIGSGGHVYRLADLQDLSLRDHLVLEQETAELGRRLDMTTIEAMDKALEACKNDAERARHPDGMWVLAVCIWAARIKAGDQVTFEQAISFPMRDLTYLPDPADRPAKKTADPTRARPASGRAAKPRAAKRSGSAKASKRASTGG